MSASTSRASSRRLRIAFVSQWYPPEPSKLPADIVAGLAERGHLVKVLTTLPNYPDGVVQPEYRAGARRREVLDGVEVFRVPSYPSHDASGARRALTFLSFAGSAARWPGPVARADVAFVYGTPLTAVAPALRARRAHGTPFVLQVQDLWPESVLASGMIGRPSIERTANALIGAAAKSVYRAAGGVIGITEPMTEELVRRGADAATSTTVYNWSTGGLEQHETARPGGPRPLRLLYAGNVGAMQDVETIVRAAAIAERSCNIEVTILGDGVRLEAVKQLAAELAVSCVRFLPRVDAAEVGQFYRETDFSLVTLMDEPVFRLNLPSKFQASLARGVPVITTVAGAATEICRSHGCGLAAQPENPVELAAAIVKAARMKDAELDEMNRNAHDATRRLFSRDQALEQIEAALQGAVADAKEGE